LDDLGVDGEIILKYTLKTTIDRACTDLPQNMDKWWDFMKAAMKLRFPQIQEIF
jgi:hypothetical protein